MALLVIEGTTYFVQSTNATQPARLRIGEFVTAFDGTGRSSVRAYKSRHRVELEPMNATDYGTLLDTIAFGLVTVSGELVGGTVTCDVEVVSSQYIKNVSVDEDYEIIPTLEIRET